jgi:hypothetical protein
MAGKRAETEGGRRSAGERLEQAGERVEDNQRERRGLKLPEMNDGF